MYSAFNMLVVLFLFLLLKDLCAVKRIFFYFFMFCFVLTSPPLMLRVLFQTFEAALFWKKKK